MRTAKIFCSAVTTGRDTGQRETVTQEAESPLTSHIPGEKCPLLFSQVFEMHEKFVGVDLVKKNYLRLHRQ